MGSLETTPVSTQPPTLLGDRARPELDRLRDAYVETVMSVPHFEEVYGESYRESLARELNEELAVAITTTGRLTP